jgi:hypothetical protein
VTKEDSVRIPRQRRGTPISSAKTLKAVCAAAVWGTACAGGRPGLPKGTVPEEVLHEVLSLRLCSALCTVDRADAGEVDAL